MIYEKIAKFYSKKIKNNLERLLDYADIGLESEKFLGFVLSFGFLLALALGFNLKGFFGISFFLTFFITLLATQLGVYFWLIIRVDRKASVVEEVLPDAMQLMASNLRAGLTTERAILLASRPEFGPLQKEIDNVGKKLAVGVELADALSGMSKKIQSRVLEKTLILIKTGLESGGSLAPLLEQIAENLREQQLVRKRIRANVLMYVIFIFAAVSFGSPMLFGLSSFLVRVLTQNIAAIDIPPEATSTIDLPFTIAQVSISETFLITFVIISLVVNSLFASIILGLIGKGREKDGIKFIPFMILVSLGVFFLVRLILKTMFSTLFGL